MSGALDEAPLHLRLNKAARQVKIDKEKNKVVVRFTDGTQVVADAAVVAVPLSVISSGDLQFEPFLPKAYYEATREMGGFYCIKKNNCALYLAQDQILHVSLPLNLGVVVQ